MGLYFKPMGLYSGGLIFGWANIWTTFCVRTGSMGVYSDNVFRNSRVNWRIIRQISSKINPNVCLCDYIDNMCTNQLDLGFKLFEREI